MHRPSNAAEIAPGVDRVGAPDLPDTHDALRSGSSAARVTRADTSAAGGAWGSRADAGTGRSDGSPAETLLPAMSTWRCLFRVATLPVRLPPMRSRCANQLGRLEPAAHVVRISRWTHGQRQNSSRARATAAIAGSKLMTCRTPSSRASGARSFSARRGALEKMAAPNRDAVGVGRVGSRAGYLRSRYLRPRNGSGRAECAAIQEPGWAKRAGQIPPWLVHCVVASPPIQVIAESREL